MDRAPIVRDAATARATILLVEPDEATERRLGETLANDGYRPVIARNGNEAVIRLREVAARLVLMEWALPDMEGLGLCRYIRAHGAVPIIVVSDTYSEADTVASLEAGADAYLTKPIRGRELVARIGALLRRCGQTPPRRVGRVYVVGDVILDADSHEVWVGARSLKLPMREFQVLEALVGSAGKVWTKEALMRRVWGETPPSGTKSLGVHVSRLRARIENDPSSPTRILTVRGTGYVYSASDGEPHGGADLRRQTPG